MEGPRISERDARTLTRAIVRHLCALGAHVETFGVHLQREGFCFRALVNGRDVWTYTGQGNVRYDRVAADLLHAASIPRDDTLTIIKDA